MLQLFKDIIFQKLNLIVPVAGHCLLITFITQEFKSMRANSLKGTATLRISMFL